MHDLIIDHCGSDDRLTIKLRGGSVLRYHAEGIPGLHQTVSEHTWRAMVILMHLWPDTSMTCLNYMLYHDVPEGITGDLPAPTKRHPPLRVVLRDMEVGIAEELQIPSEGVLFNNEHYRVKVADYLELCLTCSEIPHKTARRVMQKGLKYVREAANFLPSEEQHRIAVLVSKIVSEAINVP